MKKKTIIILIIILVAVMLIPIPLELKDGGSVEYRALLYKVTKVHKIQENGEYENGYSVAIFGKEIYKKTTTTVNVEALKVDNVTMTIKEGTLTSTGAVVVITDLNEEKYIYGAQFEIEQFYKGRWNDVKTIREDIGWNLMAYNVDENNVLEMEQNWEYMYGALEKGQYRLIKNVAKDNNILYFAVEFTIE